MNFLHLNLPNDDSKQTRPAGPYEYMNKTLQN